MLGGPVQQYAVYAFRGAKSKAHAARILFRCRGEADDQVQGSEPASPTGLLAQLMRHNELLMRLTTSAQTQQAVQFERTLTRSQGRIEDLEKREVELISLREQLLNQKSDRQLAHRKALADEDRKTELLALTKALLPTAVNRIAGKKLLPESTTPGMEMFRSVATSLTPEQVQQLQGVLTPQQFIAVLEMVRNVLDDEEKTRGAKAASSKKAPNGTTQERTPTS